MVNKKPSLKDFLTAKHDDGMNHIRRKMNKKSHKGRHYGGGIPAGTSGNDAGGAVGMGESDGMGMHNGVLPNSFTPNVISRVPNGGRSGSVDTKKENRRNAPRKRTFAEFLRARHQAEEEEFVDDFDDFDEFEDDEPMNDFDRLEQNAERDPGYTSWRDELEGDMEDPDELEDEEFDFPFDPYAEDPDDEYSENEEQDEDEFDDLDPEEELDFDDEFDDEFGDEFDDDFEEDDASKLASMGTFADFYRADSEEDHMSDVDDEFGDEFGDEDDVDDVDLDDFEEDDFEEEQEIGPGGFEPGAAVGPETSTGRPGAVGGGQGAGTKIHRARVLFKQLVNNPDLGRGDIIEQFISQLGVTESTAVSYYERLAKEAGLTNQGNNDTNSDALGDDEMTNDEGFGDEMMEPEIDQEEVDNQPPDRQGIIRRVDNAHLIYKRQMEDGGFEELWIYNVADKLDDALTIRRAILSGTDIPRGHTRSEDGQQSYTLTTMGNAQLLHITGLAN